MNYSGGTSNVPGKVQGGTGTKSHRWKHQENFAAGPRLARTILGSGVVLSPARSLGDACTPRPGAARSNAADLSREGTAAPHRADDATIELSSVVCATCRTINGSLGYESA
ncbi:hypothetical protein MRX96_030050 [Rhipicephalus microplus]